jgi:hypothetical protein
MSERAAITPEEFFKRLHESIEEAAFGLSQIPHDRHEEWLQGFAERVEHNGGLRSTQSTLATAIPLSRMP